MTRDRKIPGTNSSTVPPSVAAVPKPNFPIRSGVNAAGTSILIFVAMFCMFQYWLLTATMEAYHAGDDSLPLGAFIASLVCFLLATGLTILGEVALLKQQDFLANSIPHKAIRLGDDYANTISALHAEHRNPHKGNAAGGGDAG